MTTELIEEISGTKAICKFLGGICWRTARQRIKTLEKKSGMVILEREGGKTPSISASVYRRARLMVAGK